VTDGRRYATIATTFIFSLLFLAGAAGVHLAAKRRATETPVVATVAKLWSEKAKYGLVYHAQLIYDRKQSDGQTVHCDVPRVDLGAHPAAVGTTIEVAPRANTCWEPDVVCENCVEASDDLASGMLVIAIVSGLICSLLIWSTVRDTQNKVA
jgi:hypothetical protein